MRVYLVKRILFFIPVLFFIILLSFVLLHYSPGDPAQRIANAQWDESLTANDNSKDVVLELRKQLGLDLNLFYFSLTSLKEKQLSTENWK